MPIIQHTSASSAIPSLTFVTVDPEDEIGQVFMTFKDGKQYVIDEFPAIEFERWIGSGSIGGYFNAFVRGNY